MTIAEKARTLYEELQGGDIGEARKQFQATHSASGSSSLERSGVGADLDASALAQSVLAPVVAELNKADDAADEEDEHAPGLPALSALKASIGGGNLMAAASMSPVYERQDSYNQMFEERGYSHDVAAGAVAQLVMQGVKLYIGDLTGIPELVNSVSSAVITCSSSTTTEDSSTKRSVMDPETGALLLFSLKKTSFEVM